MAPAHLGRGSRGRRGKELATARFQHAWLGDIAVPHPVLVEFTEHRSAESNARWTNTRDVLENFCGDDERILRGNETERSAEQSVVRHRKLVSLEVVGVMSMPRLVGSSLAQAAASAGATG